MEEPLSTMGIKRSLECPKLSGPLPKKGYFCFDSRGVSLAGTNSNPDSGLLNHDDDVLRKIFSHLSTHDLVTCKLLNRHISSLIDDSYLLPLAYWKHIPPSVWDSYTKEQYELRHRPYLVESRDHSSVKKCDEMLKNPAIFPQRLLFYMKGRLITANDFTCCKKTIYTCKRSEDFRQIINEYSHCFLIEEYVENDMSRNVVEIDTHEKKTNTISYKSEIIRTRICKNSGRIATLLKGDPKGGYVELHKLDEGKWQSIFKRECCLQSGFDCTTSNYTLTRDHRCLVFKSDDKTLSIWKENDKGEWLNQSSIPCSGNIREIKFSCDGNFLLILTKLQMQLWKIDDQGHYQKCITEKFNHRRCFFSEDDQFLITMPITKINSASALRILALRGETICEYPCTPPPENIISNHKILHKHLSPDSSTLILSIDEHVILIYEKNPVDNMYTLKNVTDSIQHRSIVFSKNGRFFLVRTMKNILKIWKKNNQGIWQQQMMVPHIWGIQPQFSGNSTCLVTVPPRSNYHTPYSINVLKLNREGGWTSKQFYEDFSVNEIKWFPDNNHFLTIHGNRNINRWTIEPVQDEASMEREQEQEQD